MEIVSQDGMRTVPYKHYGICVSKDNHRYGEWYIAYIVYGDILRLATYTSEEKAFRAMALLEDAYNFTKSQDYHTIVTFRFPGEYEICNLMVERRI